MNSIIGTQNSMGPGRPIPTTLRSQPHWKMATITPYAAPIDSRFMTPALTATRTDRNTASSRRKESTMTAATMMGRRAPTWSLASMAMAVTLPT